MKNTLNKLLDEFESLLEDGQSFTIRDILRFSVSLFNQEQIVCGHGTDNSYDEAVYLILHTLNLPLDQLEPYLDARLLNSEIKQLLLVIRSRVIDRLPAPYITNSANFLGYEFYVDQRVIIPRSYLAELMFGDQLLPFIEYKELVHNTLDLCTGNGSLAIMANDYFSDSNIIASDISDDALLVAKINCTNYGLDEKITLIKSDLFEGLTTYKGKFDLILTNPPYVDTKRMKSLPKEYLHEPQLALEGGSDGLIIVDKILKEAYNYLTPDGILVVEMGDNKEQLEAKYPLLNFNWLETANGQGVVFVLTYNDLIAYFKK